MEEKEREKNIKKLPAFPENESDKQARTPRFVPDFLVRESIRRAFIIVHRHHNRAEFKSARQPGLASSQSIRSSPSDRDLA